MRRAAGDKRLNGTLLLLRELRRRSREPWREAAFVIGVLLNVAFGGWAIWLELLALSLGTARHDVESLQSAMVTYFPAVAGASFVQGVFENREDKRFLGFLMLFLLLMLGPAVYFAFVAPSSTVGRVAALAVLCMAAMWFWSVVNADAETFQDDSDAATGGDPNAPLGGDLAGLQG